MADGERLRRLRARRRAPGPQRAHRLANSIRLPWGVGLAVLLLLALAVALLVGRTDDSPLAVPRAILDDQQTLAVAAAQSVRRSLNEGVADLNAYAGVVAATGRGAGEPQTGLRPFAAAHGRYTDVLLLDGSGRVLAHEGTGERVGLPRPPYDQARIAAPGGRPDGARPLVDEIAPMRVAGTPIAAIVGRYDPEFLRFPLQPAASGSAWIVDRSGRVVGSLSDPPKLVRLPRAALREAAASAARGDSGARSTGGSLDRQEIIAHAPVTGFGAAGRLGWSVVTARSVTGFSLPATDARRQGLLAGIAMAVFVACIFGWLHIIVMRPITRLQSEAQRLAYGDLSRNVEVIRYDEIGLIARALERIRILLIRRRSTESRRPAGRTGEESADRSS